MIIVEYMEKAGQLTIDYFPWSLIANLVGVTIGCLIVNVWRTYRNRR